MNLERTPPTVVSYPPWLGGWCALTAAATFVLVAIGTLVTTFRVGMADSVWPTPPWHLLFHERAADFGWYVEHSHRIAGYLVGLCILVQTLAVWRYGPSRGRRVGSVIALAGLALGTGWGMYLVRTAPDRSIGALANPGFLLAVAAALGFLALAAAELASRTAGRWQRALVTAAFVGVIVQGMLGGLRVYLNELRGPELAVIHGIFGQVVFASVCLLALMTTRRWNALTDLVTEAPLRRLTAATLALLLVQIAFGGLLRHLDNPLARRLHPLLAFAALALVVWTTARTFLDVDGAALLRRKAVGLLILVGLQAALGVETLLRTADPAARYQAVTEGDAALRSLHVLVGFGIFASAALLAARAWKARLI